MKRISRDPELKKMDCGKDIPVGGPALTNLPKMRLFMHDAVLHIAGKPTETTD
jgi:hypothetical protein